MGRPTVLVVGASGIVGRAALEHFTSLPGWRAIGLSRRAPDLDEVEHRSVDLLDAVACEGAADAFSEVTHLVYAALYEKPGLLPGWLDHEQMSTNLRMLESCMTRLLAKARGLRHVSLLQGTKAYAAHVGRMRVPGREREPRVEHPNFYWLQEDWLRERREGADWCFTIWRPPVIIGHAIGAPMNLLAVFGVYAALAQAAGRRFAWPGGPVGPMDVVDARLLARALAWAAGEAGEPRPEAADETFNVTNGDVLVASNVWPRIGACFGLEPGPDAPQKLAESLPAQSDAWADLVREHDLRAPGLLELTGDSLIYADMLLGAGRSEPMPSPLLSTIKIRQAGFGDCIDSEDMFREWIERLQQMRVLPPAAA
jgi:nucleoside-diphosphate-sugar epimerase